MAQDVIDLLGELDNFLFTQLNTTEQRDMLNFFTRQAHGYGSFHTSLL